MKRIVYIDGGRLIVCTPVINTYPEPEPITEDEAIARAMAKLPETATDVHVLDATAIPASRANRAGWVFNADKTAVIEGAPTVPQSVTRRQAKAALLLAKDAQGVTLLSKVQPAIDAIPATTLRALMQIEWDESQNFERNRPSLIQIATALGLDSAGLDQLFITAASL